MNKKKMLIIAAVIVAVVAGIITVISLVSRHNPIPGIMSEYTWGIPTDKLDAALFKDGQLTERGIAFIDEAMDGYEAGSADALRLAAYAAIRTRYGYPEEAARRKLTNQIAAIDVTHYYSDSIFETLCREVKWTRELLFGKYNTETGKSHASMLEKIAKNSGDLSLEKRIEWALAIENPGIDAAGFLSASLTETDIPELITMLTELTDPERLELCGKALASRSVQLEEIVPVLYHLRQQGMSLGKIFPQGVKVTMDLSGLNALQGIPEQDDPLPEGSRYLIVSRRETGIKAEALWEKPRNGYSSHDKEDPSAFEVRIETGWIDRIDPDRLPASYTDCRWLVVADVQYIYDGCITELKDYATGAKESNRYYPVYGCLYRLVTVERDGLAPRQIVDSMSVDADKDQVVARWTNIATGASMSSYRVIPDDDSAWMDEALQKFLDKQ